MNNKKLNIILASPRGFCAGVDRAIEIVKKTLEKYGPPVYIRHEIVHNKSVVESLKKLGAVFIEEVSEIPDPSRPIIFSAHGVPKSVPEETKLKKIFYIDATCPLVSKVHRETEQLYKEGFDIILIGHKNHPEVIGTMGQLPDGTIKLIETIDEVKNLNCKKPVAYVTQTTLSVDDTKKIVDALRLKFPNIKGPVKEDICYATTNRQNAVKKIAPNCDMFFIIGSVNSSNSARLVEVAKKSGCRESELIFSGKPIPIEKIKRCKNIGLSSGASAPEELIQNFISEIKKHINVSVEKIITAREKVTFKLPRELN
ncbi:MAG: 4-hydroxy-3-methylbut-2-enyl diphosphate reductase [Pelagibacteraceae bacterium]|nr:4-hydroxy-3-methylbut-2-enyl diphosphate reductase [Pelagibacteraceae bacterium]